MLELPAVTLLTIETRLHALAKLAMEDCLACARFGAVVTAGNRPLGLKDETFIHCPDFSCLEGPGGLAEFFWQKLADCFQTSHALVIDYDSWIIDPSMWVDEFLSYDYVGAPWWYKDGFNVGSAGFLLVSRRMMRHIADHQDRYPIAYPLDEVWCRQYRTKLEEDGFKWAPDALAARFAFECTRPTGDSRHFGFHDVFNWPLVLTRERLIERLALMDQYHWDKNKVQNCLKAFQNNELSRLIDDVCAYRQAKGAGKGVFEAMPKPDGFVSFHPFLPADSAEDNGAENSEKKAKSA